MIDFTGERFIPTVTMEEEIAVEHLQRYLSVLELVQGKIVLDAACGEGYGTSLMSESAKKCYGVDISEDVIRHAKNKYSSFGLEYLASSVNNLPFKDGAFDIIISFETIEHLDDISQKSFMGEIKRTLKNEGALVISTPDKIVYSEGNRAPNKFHLKEFYRDEFYSFLKKHFMFVDFFYQKRQAASVLSQPDQKKLKVVHSKEFGFGTYIVAVCSAVKLRPKASLGSIIYDLDNKYVRNVNRILELQQEVEKLGAWGTSLKALVDEKNNTIKRCQFYIASNERQLKEIQEISGEEKEKRLSEISLMKEEVADLQEAHNKASRELSSAKQYEKDIQDKFFSLKEKLSRERENRDRDTQKLKEYEFDKVKRQEELRELQQKNEHITREFHFIEQEKEKAHNRISLLDGECQELHILLQQANDDIYNLRKDYADILSKRDSLEKIRERLELNLEVLQSENKKYKTDNTHLEETLKETKEKIYTLRATCELQEGKLKALKTEVDGEHAKVALFEGWLHEMARDSIAIFSSLRWKLGDSVASVFEFLLFRFNKKTAKDHIEEILSEYNAFCCGKVRLSQKGINLPGLKKRANRWKLFFHLICAAVKRPRQTIKLMNRERVKNLYVTLFKQAPHIRENIFDYYIKLYADSSLRLSEQYRGIKDLSGVNGRRNTLQKSNDPFISIIIPAYNQWKYTERCIRSVHASAAGLRYEIILADDCSTDDTLRANDIFPDIIMVRTPGNYGFLKNCNNASLHAAGDFIVFLNNDTVVHENWLHALLEVIEGDSMVGIAGSKLVYPDGKLQEAGGIIWSDASGWNFGRCDDPEKPEYNYVKEVDYISGASIVVRASLWREIGGFDERYAPAYYEDTDLAFEVRMRGFKVVYTPFSIVTHYEGQSHGIVDNAGVKKYQAINKLKFFEKWRKVLEKNHLQNGENLFLARDRSCNKKTILVIDHYVPHYDKDAGSRSTFQYLQWLVRRGFNVKFLGDNFCQHEPYTSDLQAIGIEVLYGAWYQENWQQWLEINGVNINYIYLHRPHIAVKYIDICRKMTKAKLIYFGHDLHWLRTERQYELEKKESVKKQAQDWREKEFAIFEKVDVIFYPSVLEEREVKKYFPDKVVKTIPLNIYDNVSLKESFFEERKDLLFVGGFGHPPNIDAVLWFVEEVFPVISHKIPEIRFIIVGSKVPEEILQLQSAHIVVVGEVSDQVLENLYRQCRLSVVPLRYGAGVKGKILESMKMQLPVITTKIGAEGLPDPMKYLQIASDSQDFADKVLSLYFDKRKWGKQAAHGVKCLNTYFSKERVEEIWSEVVEMPSQDSA